MLDDLIDDALVREVYPTQGAPTPKPPEPDPNKAPRRFWAAMRAQAVQFLASSLPTRTLTAWRVTREILRLRLEQHDEPLTDLRYGPDNDPWEHPRPPIAFHPSDKRRREADALLLLNKHELPLHPATLADNHTHSQLVYAISNYLKLPTTGLELATHSLTRAYPTPLEVVEIERQLVEEALEKLVELQTGEAHKHFVRKYGLEPAESTLLLRLARSKAKNRLESDLEEEKALYIFQMEDFIQRCRREGDLRLEMYAHKQLGMIRGFTKMETDDFGAEFVKVARRVASEDRSKEIKLLR